MLNFAPESGVWEEEGETSRGDMRIVPTGTNLPRRVVRRPGIRAKVPEKNPVRSEEMKIPRRMMKASCSDQMGRKSPKHGDRSQH